MWVVSKSLTQELCLKKVRQFICYIVQNTILISICIWDTLQTYLQHSFYFCSFFSRDFMTPNNNQTGWGRFHEGSFSVQIYVSKLVVWIYEEINNSLWGRLVSGGKSLASSLHRVGQFSPNPPDSGAPQGAKLGPLRFSVEMNLLRLIKDY